MFKNIRAGMFGKSVVDSPGAWRLSIVLACAAAYLPAINNSFISDDFTLIQFLEALRQDPSALWANASEFFRAMSYVYFSMTFKLFGLKPELHYVASIALHAAVSLLVFALMRSMFARRSSAWAAAIFFAVYARHEEAVMWISANNSTIVALNCLLFLLAWERYLTGRRARASYFAAIGLFALALFSKETAVALAPLAVLRMKIRNQPSSEILRRTWPLAAICAAYVLLWLSQAHRNFFVADGHHAIGFHFFTVYARSVLSLLSSAIPFVLALSIAGLLRVALRNSNCAFFLTWILLTLAPVSFLTYSKYIDSRNTYLPSVALAALVGIFFTVLLDNAATVRGKKACGLLLAAVLAWNMSYLWRRQDAEYVKRAAPTRQLIALLNDKEFSAQSRPIQVCGFPLDSSIGFAAVGAFTNVAVDDVRISKDCSDTDDGSIARWDAAKLSYISAQRISELRSPQ
jgi:hypothetical protein